MKILLYPLIGILHLSTSAYAVFNFNPEFAVVAAGLLASSLIGAIYFSPFVIVAGRLSQRGRSALSPALFKTLGALWLASLMLIVVGETLAMAIAVMIGAGIFVITRLGLSAMGLGVLVLRTLEK